MRNILRLGLLALTALALSGIGASGASAAFESSAYPSKITSTQQATSYLTTEWGMVECKIGFSGEIVAATPVASLAMSGTCASFGINQPIVMNGCKAQLDSKWKTLNFGPSGCGPITLQIGTCSISIPAQTGLFASFENVAGGVSMSVDDKKLTYINSAGCNKTGPAVGKFSGKWLLAGSGNLSVQTGEPLGEAGKFVAESFPASLTGAQAETAPLAIFTEGGKITCTSLTFGGSLPSASSSLALAPTFAGCQAFGFTEATVAANGCSFVYRAGNSQDVSCPAGSSITVSTARCGMSIPAQTGLKSVAYTNVRPSGERRKVEVTSSVTKLAYTVTRDEFGCPFGGTGSKTSGSITGSLLVEGLNAQGYFEGIALA